MSTRTTERQVARALLDACTAFGLRCAYDADGQYLPRAGGHIIDHQPQYGGARVQFHEEGSGAHLRADAVFTANGIPSGMDTRRPLREVLDILRTLTVNAYAAQGEATPDDLDAVS